jgi:hypothetical protein
MLSHHFHPTSRCEELIIAIRDQSGSMWTYNSALDAACLSFQSKYSAVDSKYALHFVAFAGLGKIADSPNISHLKHICGNTSIPQAFERAVEIAKKKQPISMFSKVILVFISDGEDNDMQACMKAIGRLRPMPWPCRLICVGFRGFPTSLASGRLFEVFGTGNQLCDPPVLPCDDPGEVPDVFKNLCHLIENPDPSPQPTLDNLDSAVSIQDLLQAAGRSYNACMVSCLYKKTVPEFEAFSACKVVLAYIRTKLCRETRRLKAMKTTEPALLTEVLSYTAPSILLKQATTASKAVEGMQSRVSDCLDKASRKELVSRLDDETKRRLVGFAAREGKLTTKALLYHSPDSARIHKSFVDFIDSYPYSRDGLALDTATRAAAGVHTLYDVISDAKRILHVLRDPTCFSPLDMVEKMPQFGIPVHVARLTPGAAMNCWLVQVTRVWLCCLTTVQAIQEALKQAESRHSQDDILAGYFSSDDEDCPPLPPVPVPSCAPEECEPNCLALVPSELPGPDTSYLRFTASVLLYNEPLYHNYALMSLYAATAVRLLQASPLCCCVSCRAWLSKDFFFVLVLRSSLPTLTPRAASPSSTSRSAGLTPARNVSRPTWTGWQTTSSSGIASSLSTPPCQNWVALTSRSPSSPSGSWQQRVAPSPPTSCS